MRLAGWAWSALALAAFAACGESLTEDTPVATADGGVDGAADATTEERADTSPGGDGGCFHTGDAKAIAFGDVAPGVDGSAEIAALTEAGILDSCGAGTFFCPDDPARRREALRWATRLLVGESFPYGCIAYFNDAPATDPDFAYLQKASEMGLTSGISPGNVGPDIDTVRASIAVFASLLAGLDLGDAGLDGQAPTFDDVPSTSGGTWAAVELAVRHGFMGPCAVDAGTDSGLPLFCPNGKSTRREVAIAFDRAIVER